MNKQEAFEVLVETHILLNTISEFVIFFWYLSGGD
jgi:hypothetical protein